MPYWDGITYLPIFTKFIPRVVWPDKPVENMGQQFGHKYNRLKDEDTFTSMNTPILAEMFMNFGVWGMYLGCALLALIYLLIENVFNRKSNNQFDNVLNISFLINAFSWETNATQLIGIFIIYYIVYLVLIRVVNNFI